VPTGHRPKASDIGTSRSPHLTHIAGSQTPHVSEHLAVRILPDSERVRVLRVAVIIECPTWVKGGCGSLVREFAVCAHQPQGCPEAGPMRVVP
jgi:hypothetical protein